MHQHAVFRVLSLACSTGEEPYSIAMALLDSGLAPQHVRIDAVDISHQALRQARQAVYGHHSFRGNDLQFRERYCEQSQQVIASANASGPWSRSGTATSWTRTC